MCGETGTNVCALMVKQAAPIDHAQILFHRAPFSGGIHHVGVNKSRMIQVATKLRPTFSSTTIKRSIAFIILLESRCFFCLTETEHASHLFYIEYLRRHCQALLWRVRPHIKSAFSQSETRPGCLVVMGAAWWEERWGHDGHWVSQKCFVVSRRGRDVLQALKWFNWLIRSPALNLRVPLQSF